MKQNFTLPDQVFPIKTRLFICPKPTRVFVASMTFVLTVCMSATINAQLTGTVNVPGDYATLALAIDALNTQGVGVGGATINVVAGNPQSAPAGGYVIGGAGSMVLTTSSMTQPITLQGNGNTVTAFAPQTTGNLNDAVVKLIGADWVTITGFTLTENALNTITAAATNDMTEWGIALLYVTTTDGAQNNTIQNCMIDLNRTYQNTFGIYSNSTHAPTTPATSATATTTVGGNSGLRIYSNTITDVNHGIVVVGPTAAADHNEVLEIGGTVSTGNTISNYGTTGTFSTYANVATLAVNGVLVRNTRNITVSYNSVTSSIGGTTAGALNGIHIPVFSAAPTGTFTNSINNNSISLQSGVAASSGNINGINCLGTTASATSTININNNDFHTSGHTVAGAAGIIFLNQAGTHLNQNVNDNTFTNLSVNTTGSVTFIANTNTLPAFGVKNVNNNSIVTGFTKTGAGGTVVFFTDNGSDPSTATNNTNSNSITNISITGAASVTAIANTNGGSPIKNVTNNIINTIGGGTGTFIGMSINFDAGTTTVSGNTINNISNGGAITGIALGSSGSAGTTHCSLNTIHTLSGSGTGTVTGITVGGTTGTIKNVFKNKIYNLENSNAAGAVSGITVSSGFTNNVFNNLIGDLRTPAVSATNPLNGINITSTTSSSSINVSYNTVYLNATSSGINFGSSGIFHTTSTTSTTATLNLRNNIIVNTSTANGTGLTVVYRRSSGAANTLANYGSASNHNLFYAGTPSATNLIYSDAVSIAQSMTDYKNGVFTAGTIAPRDAVSVTENITGTFLSTTGSSSDFLHINPAIPTQAESAGIPIGGITDDYDGNSRNVSFPDIGADEFNGIAVDLTAPSISYSLFGNTSCAADRTLSATITDGTGVNSTPGTKPRMYYKKAGDANAFAGNTSADNGWKYVEASNASSPFNFTSNYALLQSPVVASDVIQYFVVAQDLAGTPNVGINTGIFNAAPASVDLMAAQAPITGTINSYTIVAPGLIGTVTIGAAGTYTTLTAADGLFNAINTGGLSGNLLVEIVDAAVTENGVTMLNDINYNGCAAGPYTLTIKPTVVSALSGSSTGAIIRLNGADNVVIDGSIGSTANTVCPLSAATRDLTVTNTNAGTASAVIYIQASGANGASNNTVKNCNIVGSSPTAGTVLGLGAGGATIGAASTAQNNSNQFINNNVSKCLNGIASFGTSAVTKNSGTVISQNTINTPSPNNCARGIFTGFENGIVISGNSVDHISGLSTGYSWGISCGLLSTSTTNTAGSEVTNATITNNTIGTVRAASTWGVSGIAVAPATSGTTLIANNMIADATTNGTFSDIGAGIYVGGATGSTTLVYYNTVTMPSALTGGAYGNFAIAVNGSNPIVQIKNNILTNTGSNGANLNRAMGFAYSTFTNLTSDNNDLFASGTGSAVVQTGTLSNTGFTTYTLVTGGGSWNAASGKDANSKNVFPVFTSLTDLHLVTPDPVNFANLEGMGMVVSVTEDIDCQMRNGALPDIGADEFVGAIPSCNTPTSISFGMITASSASVSFNCASCTGTYIVEYGVAPGFITPGTGNLAGSGGTVVTGGSSPITISGLDDGTVYNVYVRQNCGMSSFSNNSIVTSFTTSCLAFSLPYEEDFDGVTAPAIPVCSVVEDLNGVNTWVTSTDNPRSLPNALDYDWDVATPGDDWWFTPGFVLTGGTSYRLTFWYRARSDFYPEALEVEYGNAQNAASMTNPVLFSNTEIINVTYTQAVIDFTPGANGTYYIGFHNISEPDQFDLHVDDISFDVTPCPTVVTSTGNAGAGTVRDIVACAAPGSTITFDISLSGMPIMLTSEIVINKNLTFSGLGMMNLTISGGGTSRIFNLLAGNTLTIEDMALKNGFATMPNGGAIYVAGNLILENVLFESNLEDANAKSMTVTSTATVNIIGNVQIKN